MYPLGTRVMLKPNTMYDGQNVHQGQKYSGIIVANGKEATGRHRPCRDWDYKVEWQFPKDDMCTFYYYDNHLIIEAKDNEEALSLLNTEEAW